MKTPRHLSRAFSLVEVTLALGIMAFCLVAIFGLLPTGLNSDQAAIQQTAAAGIATALAADLRQTPVAPVATPSPRFLITVPAASGDGLIHTLFLTDDGAIADGNAATNPPTTAQDKNADPTYNPHYRATVVFTLPANPGIDRTATIARLLVTWPALADPKGMVLPQHASGSFETVIALDRN